MPNLPQRQVFACLALLALAWLPLLESVVEGAGAESRLIIRWKRQSSSHTRTKVLVTVVVPKLKAATLKGSGELQLDAFNTPSLKLSLAGAGDVRIKEQACN